ncbi:MAG: hypothetical protein JNM61_08755 [Zoogloeaceae bacterium]|nr:hypothetical protein [Zoogloeaceae bacterium]
MNHLEAFEAATDAGGRMFVRAGAVILSPEHGEIDAHLLENLARHRDVIRAAVFGAAEAVERARRQSARCGHA